MKTRVLLDGFQNTKTLGAFSSRNSIGPKREALTTGALFPRERTEAPWPQVNQRMRFQSSAALWCQPERTAFHAATAHFAACSPRGMVELRFVLPWKQHRKWWTASPHGLFTSEIASICA